MIKNRQIIYPILLLLFSWPVSSMADPSKSDLTKASTSEGCDLIPYSDKRSSCKSSQAGVHIGTSCNASPHTCDTATNCVDARTSVQGIFASTISKLEDDKKNLWKGNDTGNKQKRSLANTIIGKIQAEQPGHQDAVRNATTLKNRLCR